MTTRLLHRTLLFRPAAGVCVALSLAAALVACSRQADAPAPAGDARASAGLVQQAPAGADPAASGVARQPAASGVARQPAASGVAWQHVASDAEVDAALAAARSAGRPVLVYWGAKWCPPCNQLQATLFNRQDFIARSRAFDPLYVDGDRPGAQKLGARFRVSGYPTLVLLDPQGREVTRLPGEVDPARYSEVLTLGMSADRPVKALLADALAGGKTLKADEWRLLAFYSWDTDHEQLLPKGELTPTLAKLAAAVPAEPREAATRLALKALAAADGKGTQRPGERAAVLALLADPAAARQQTDLLTGWAAPIVRSLAPQAGDERAALLAAYEAALRRLEADPSLSRADRIQATIARVDLARIDLPDGAAASAPRPALQLPEPLVADVREHAARVDREIVDGYERQAVVTAAAYLLERAGLSSESDALLRANLARSHSPYYLMSGLASNARKRGDHAEALRWYRQAFEKSEGPATRLQWGASYVGALVDLAPDDESAIEGATVQLWGEAAVQPDAFYERSARSLQRIGDKLQSWNRDGKHAAALARLGERLQALCASQPRSDAERATCSALLSPRAKPSA